MRERKLYLVLSFSSTSRAMAFEKIAKAKGHKGRMIPLPGAISAGCGLAWRDDPTQEEGLKNMALEAGLEIEGIHRLML